MTGLFPHVLPLVLGATQMTGGVHADQVKKAQSVEPTPSTTEQVAQQDTAKAEPEASKTPPGKGFLDKAFAAQNLVKTTEASETAPGRGWTFTSAHGVGKAERQQPTDKPAEVKEKKYEVIIACPTSGDNGGRAKTKLKEGEEAQLHMAHCPLAVMSVSNEYQKLLQEANRTQGAGEGGMIAVIPPEISGKDAVEEYGKAILSGEQIPLIRKAFENLSDKIEYEIDDYIAKEYNVPIWAPTLVRFMYDLFLDEAYEQPDPMAHVFGKAAIPLQNFWNYITFLSFDDWYTIRSEAYVDEFVDFKTYTAKEARMMAYCYQNIAPETLQAAQFISRDHTCQAAWKVIANYPESNELTENVEFNAYWAASISDVARRAALEIIALANGYQDIDQSCLRLLKVTFEELNVNYYEEPALLAA
jgi:hypothetical protein